MDFKELQVLTKKLRGFNVEDYYEQKLESINSFFKENNLDAAVLGISGGIDSAVVLYLLHKAKQLPDSPIRQILPISIPILDSEGVTGQVEAADNAYIVMDSLGYNCYEVDISDASESIVQNSCDVHEKQAWAIGQMNSVLRTPVLYYHAAILQTFGFKSLVVGTTNRDEGCYIGFFGKASDAMVDLQIISDIHKSEVYALAEYMNVPRETIDRKPKGDVWDGKVDEEMIGAPYWFLEMYLIMKIYGNEQLANYLSVEEKELYDKYSSNIESLHNINSHKYKVGNPAHFIDNMPRRIRNGWQ